MAIDFPTSPTVGQTYTYGANTWQWNGNAWDNTSTTFGPQGIQGVQGITGTGVQGTVGLQGVQGVYGTQGIQGIQGLLGTQGITGSSTKVTKSSVSLGTVTNNNTFVETVVTSVAQRGYVSYFSITSSAATYFDVEVRSAASGGGSQMLYAAGIPITNYTISTVWYYEADSGDSMYIRIRNNGGSSATFTLTSMRVERYA
jgi:hypothetical protein